MVRLDKFKEEDFDTFKSWINDENELLQFAGTIFSFPIDNQQLVGYINDEKRIPLKVVLNQSNETIGHCELNFENKLPRLSRILIGKKELRNQGYGKRIVNEMLNLMFNKYQCDVVELNVFDWNISAIKCYQAIGFKFTDKLGTEYKHKNGVWKSLNMVLSQKEWKLN